MTTVAASLTRLFSSSIGRKWIVAVTGIVLLLFLLGHMTGNLLLFMGAEAFNGYAHFLKTMLHGAGIWIARIVLLVAFVAHIYFTIVLARENRVARPTNYECKRDVQAKLSTRLMLVSGLTILAFVVYHILHFTITAWNTYETYHTTVNGQPAHDAYRMVIDGFLWVPAALFYLIAMALLCSHLHHGVSSVFQTIGLRTRQNHFAIDLFGKAYALVIFIGFISIPLAVQFRIVGHEESHPQEEVAIPTTAGSTDAEESALDH